MWSDLRYRADAPARAFEPRRARVVPDGFLARLAAWIGLGNFMLGMGSDEQRSSFSKEISSTA